MQKGIITAIEQDGLKTRTLSMTFILYKTMNKQELIEAKKQQLNLLTQKSDATHFNITANASIGLTLTSMLQIIFATNMDSKKKLIVQSVQLSIGMNN